MEKVDFLKGGSICNVPIEASNIYNILSRPAVSNGLIIVRYEGHVYFEPVRTHIIYQAFTYLKSHNNFYKDIFIEKDLSNEDMFKFSDIVEMQGQTERDTENTSD